MERKQTFGVEDKFEYEIMGEKINLYERIDEGDRKGILNFLGQSPFRNNLESSVKQTVCKIYDSLENPESPHNYIVTDVLNSGESVSGRYLKQAFFNGFF